MGMADQSGNFQTWLSQPVLQREPRTPEGVDLLIITPDTRFPQGATLEAQQENHGAHIRAAANRYMKNVQYVYVGNTNLVPQREMGRF
jgi:hypothetical protein